jgi:hypothetical protein
MSKTYKRAGVKVETMSANILAKYHRQLHDVGIRADIVLVNAGADKLGMAKPALKVHGRTCAATVTITKVLQRILNVADVIIQIDEQIWKAVDAATQRSILDHEFEHVQLDYDKKGNVQIDAADRPLLKIKPHDADFGIFQSIVKRHGDAAIDTQHIKSLFESPAGQEVFSFYKKLKKSKGKGGTPPSPRPQGKPAAPPDDLPLNGDSKEVIKAAKHILKTKRASTASVQRALKVGFPRATRIMDHLEREGCISGPNGSNPREIFEDKLKLKASE